MRSYFDIRVLVAVTSVLAGVMTACSSSSSGDDAGAGAGGSSAGGAGVAGTSSAGPGGTSAGAAGGAAGAAAGGTTSAGPGGTSALGGTTAAGGTSSTGGTSAGGTSAGGTSGGSNVIAMALYSPQDLQIFGTDAYWTQQGTGINKIALTGGKPALIVSDSNPSSLAVDATGIYYVGTAGIVHTGLDGTNPTTVTAIDGFSGEKLAIVGTKLYFAGKVGNDSGIVTVPTAGGTPTLVYTSLSVNGLDVADATAGLVWEELDAGTVSTTLMHAGLDGSNPTAITALPISSSQYFKGASTDGTNIYYGVRDQMPSPDQSYLFSVPAAGGTPTKVFTFTGELTTCVADASGSYFGDNQTASAGVYKAGTDGTTSTLITAATEGNVRFLRLDATHLAWMSGDDSGQSRLHVATR